MWATEATSPLDCPTSSRVTFQKLIQVWVIDHSLLLDHVCATTYLSIYVILNLLSWSSAVTEVSKVKTHPFCCSEDCGTYWQLLLERIINLRKLQYVTSSCPMLVWQPLSSPLLCLCWHSVFVLSVCASVRAGPPNASLPLGLGSLLRKCCTSVFVIRGFTGLFKLDTVQMYAEKVDLASKLSVVREYREWLLVCT